MKQHHGCAGAHSKRPQTQLATAFSRLKEAGLKLTRPRQALLELISLVPAPFTTDQAFQAANGVPQGGKFDLVTVYRSLSTFAEIGILSKVDFGDGVVRYEWADPHGHHHHHFVCESCGNVEPLKLCEVEAQENALKAAGYSRLSHRLEFFGLCPECGVRAK